MPRGATVYEQAALQGRLWTPTSQRGLGNLLAWYDFASLVLSGSAQQDDKSGRGLHLSQATGSARPTLSFTAFQGSIPCASFDGGDGLTNTSLSVTAGTLIQAFAVFKPTWTSAFNRVVGLQTATGADSDANKYIPIIRFSSSAAVDAYSGGTIASSVAFASGAVGMAASILTASTHQTFVNGTGGTAVSFTYPAAFSPTKILIGQSNSIAADALTGAIVEVILLTGAIAVIERQRIEGYFGWRHQLANLLPASHPFKNRPPLIGD